MIKKLVLFICMLAVLRPALRADMQFLFPHPPLGIGLTAFLIDATDEKVACVFRIPKNGDLQTVGFHTGTVTTWQDLRVSFQDVDMATGDPDGVQDQYRVVTGADTDDNVWKASGIVSSNGTDGGTKRSVTQGQLLAVVINFDATIGNLNISMHNNSANIAAPFGESYIDHYVGAPAWAKSSSTNCVLSLEYTDGYTFTPTLYPYLAIGSTLGATLAYNVDTAGQDEAGNDFQVPVSVKTKGLWVLADLDGAADLVLYDSGMTAVTNGSCTFDPEVRAGNFVAAHVCYFTAEVTLTAATTYTIFLKPTTTTSVTLYFFTINADAIMAQFEGGTSITWTQRVNAGSKSANAAKRALMGIVISSVPAAAGGGGASFIMVQ